MGVAYLVGVGWAAAGGVASRAHLTLEAALARGLQLPGSRASKSPTGVRTRARTCLPAACRCRCSTGALTR